MSALTFTLKQELKYTIDCSALSNLKGKNVTDIADITLQYGKITVRAADLFDISGSDTENVHFSNSSDKLNYLGANWSGGKLTVTGDTGAYLGYQMKQGEIHVRGNSGDFAACNMAGGLLKIDGNTGHFLGGASAGLRKGMRGGMVIVKGNAGDRVGDQMRRGQILIEGNVGDYCGSRMIAGTIGVLGNLGEYAGYNMQRGTLLLTKQPNLHATLQDCGTHTLPFLRLLFKSFRQLDSKFAQLNSPRVQRYVGDVACNGNGEILVIVK
jgi:formylmethanofuran dehydrogenase subunit C